MPCFGRAFSQEVIMPLENASTISELDSTWPLGLDSSSRGDDHLRLLKAVLKAQFPGSGGQGYSKPITVSEDDLNALPTKLADIGKTYFPVGTVVLRMDAINPSTIYGGTWALITGDAVLTFGNGAAQTGNASGNNTPGVPVPLHSHGTIHNLSARGVGDHQHGGVPARIRVEVGGSTGTLYSVYHDGSTSPAGAHGHIIDGGVSVSNAGSDNSTIDVRGARIAINVWRRTAL